MSSRNASGVFIRVETTLGFSRQVLIKVYNIKFRLNPSSGRGADKSLARPTSRCISFDGENISFDVSLFMYINSINTPLIIIIGRIYENQNLLSLHLVSFLVGLRTYQHPCRWAGVWTDRHDEINRHSSRLMQTRLKHQSAEGARLYVTVTYLLNYLLTHSLHAAESLRS
jgi:hypothetical protein